MSADLTPAELDAIEARLAAAKSLSNRLYPLAYSDVEDLLCALHAAWEERDRLAKLVKEAWEISSAFDAVSGGTPPGEGATDG